MMPMNLSAMHSYAPQLDPWALGFSQIESEGIKGKGKARIVSDVVDLEKSFQQLVTEEKEETKNPAQDYMSDFQK